MILILFFLASALAAEFDVYGYTTDWQRLDSSYLTCNTDSLCLNVYNSILKIYTNASYVCYYPYSVDCYSYDFSESGSYQSFGIAFAPFSGSQIEVMDRTTFQSKSFGMNFVMQCMNYDEMLKMRAICLMNV
jgi:hypothetical protein